MKAGLFVLAIILAMNSALYAGDLYKIERPNRQAMLSKQFLEDFFKERYRSNLGNYNERKIKGYEIQPPVPPGWYYKGCREGDYNCMQRFYPDEAGNEIIIREPELIYFIRP